MDGPATGALMVRPRVRGALRPSKRSAGKRIGEDPARFRKDGNARRTLPDNAPIVGTMMARNSIALANAIKPLPQMYSRSHIRHLPQIEWLSKQGQ